MTNAIDILPAPIETNTMITPFVYHNGQHLEGYPTSKLKVGEKFVAGDGFAETIDGFKSVFVCGKMQFLYSCESGAHYYSYELENKFQS